MSEYSSRSAHTENVNLRRCMCPSYHVTVLRDDVRMEHSCWILGDLRNIVSKSPKAGFLEVAHVAAADVLRKFVS